MREETTHNEEASLHDSDTATDEAACREPLPRRIQRRSPRSIPSRLCSAGREANAARMSEGKEIKHIHPGEYSAASIHYCNTHVHEL